jgi:hypothetical protein
LKRLVKTIINYLKQTKKLKGGQLQQLISTFLKVNKDKQLISEGGNKDPTVSRLEISFMSLFKLEKLSILGYFV